MELKRNIYKKLLAWKESNTGHVLELRGARQVGKTYILKKFGKENFSKMVYINMAETTGKNFLKCISIATEWEPGKPTEENPVRKALELYDSTFEDNKETVVIIDEIQECSCWFVQNMKICKTSHFYCFLCCLSFVRVEGSWNRNN